MTFIPIIPEEQATEQVRLIYDTYRAPWGGVDSILKIHSLMPQTLKPHVDLYRTLMFAPGPLTRREREMIATVVSVSNRCDYCVHHHADALLRVTRDRPLADAVRNNFRTAGLKEAERAMLVYAEALTLRPGSDHEPLVQRMKAYGASDETILHVALVTAYFNFVNRMALGLAVELETYWQANGYSDPSLPMSHDEIDQGRP